MRDCESTLTPGVRGSPCCPPTSDDPHARARLACAAGRELASPTGPDPGPTRRGGERSAQTRQDGECESVVHHRVGVPVLHVAHSNTAASRICSRPPLHHTRRDTTSVCHARHFETADTIKRGGEELLLEASLLPRYTHAPTTTKKSKRICRLTALKASAPAAVSIIRRGRSSRGRTTWFRRCSHGRSRCSSGRSSR